MKRRGFVLLEILAVFAVLAILSLGTLGYLHARAAEVRSLYEERVAWEAAAGWLEALEESGFDDLREGRSAVAIDGPGLENLEAPAAAIVVSSEPGGVRRVTVELSWTDFRGALRRVEARTRAGGGP